MEVTGVQEALAFVREHGVVLASARGPVPTLTEHIAGAPIRGSWWGHPEGKRIFAVLERVSADPELLVCRLVGHNITFVHRRLWPALVAAAPLLDPMDMARLTQAHTARGHHENQEVPFPDWVPPDVMGAATLFEPAAALAALGAAFVTHPKPRKGR